MNGMGSVMSAGNVGSRTAECVIIGRYRDDERWMDCVCGDETWCPVSEMYVAQNDWPS